MRRPRFPGAEACERDQRGGCRRLRASGDRPEVNGPARGRHRRAAGALSRTARLRSRPAPANRSRARRENPPGVRPLGRRCVSRVERSRGSGSGSFGLLRPAARGAVAASQNAATEVRLAQAEHRLILGRVPSPRHHSIDRERHQPQAPSSRTGASVDITLPAIGHGSPQRGSATAGPFESRRAGSTRKRVTPPPRRHQRSAHRRAP